MQEHESLTLRKRFHGVIVGFGLNLWSLLQIRRPNRGWSRRIERGGGFLGERRGGGGGGGGGGGTLILLLLFTVYGEG
jgi:hypothetical protein